jgi:hypothetical protein
MAQHFSHGVIVRAPGLLPMLYTPRELEEELGIPSCTVRDWTKEGMPFQRDTYGHIWINGIEFAAWVERVRAAKKRVRLARDEAYCLHCKKPVKLIGPVVSLEGKMNRVQGKCPTCGSTINRGGRFDQSE